jgi:hypothetical protein
VDVEQLAARLMLDGDHSNPRTGTHYGENKSICGTIKGYANVTASCPPGATGNVNAGRLTEPLFKTVLNVRLTVLVSVRSSIPRLMPSKGLLDDIRLSEVVGVRDRMVSVEFCSVR